MPARAETLERPSGVIGNEKPLIPPTKPTNSSLLGREINYSQRRVWVETFDLELGEKVTQYRGSNPILARMKDAFEDGFRFVRVRCLTGPQFIVRLDPEKGRSDLEEPNPDGAPFIVLTRVTSEGIKNPVGGREYCLISEERAAEIQIGGKIFGPQAIENQPFRSQFKKLTAGGLTEAEISLAIPHLGSVFKLLEDASREKDSENFYLVTRGVIRASGRTGKLYERPVSWMPVRPIRLNIPDTEEGLKRSLTDVNAAVQERSRRTHLEMLASDLDRLLSPEINSGRFPLDYQRTHHVHRHPKICRPVLIKGKEQWRKVDDHSRCSASFPKRAENALELFRINHGYLTDSQGGLDLGVLSWVLAHAGALANQPNFFVQPAVVRGMIPREAEYRIYELVARLRDEVVDNSPQKSRTEERADALGWPRVEVRKVPPTRRNGHFVVDASVKPRFLTRKGGY